MNKILFTFVIALVLGFGAAYVVMQRATEDYWVCQGGTWVRHGQPSAPQPSTPCTIANDQQAAPPVPGASPVGTSNYSGRGLTKLPQELLSQTGITKLDLSNNQLTSLPSEIGRLTKINELNVSYNKLTGALPAEIRLMQGLRVLNASHNQLTGIPAEVGQLKSLTLLDLSYNQIDTMPNEIANLAGSLRTLDLRGNRYSADQIEAIKAKLPGTQVLSGN